MFRLIFSLIPVLLLFLIGFAVGMENSHEVSVNLLIVQKSLPMSTIIAASLGVGFLLGLLSAIVLYIRLKIQNRRLRSELKRIQKAKV